MPIRNSMEISSRRDRLRIARRFKAGNKHPVRAVPKGRLNGRVANPSRSRPYQSPLWGSSSCLALNPALKRWAILTTALRDRASNFQKASRLDLPPGFFAIFFLLLVSTRFAFAQTEVVVDFEKAEITGRWIDSWEEKDLVFTPAHAPTRSKAKARLMFFPHISSGRKGILSAMATDPIPVRARFPRGASSVTLVLWGSTGCPARLEAFDQQGKLLDQVSLEKVPGRKAPGDPIPTFELTVKGTNIAYIEFSGPRAGEFLAADELRFHPSGAGLDSDRSSRP